MATGIDIALWIAQSVLAFIFVMAGGMKLFAYAKANESMAWVKAIDAGQVRMIGAVELLGAIAVIVPRATGILAWLTPLAAFGLALVMVSAMVFHLRRKETKEAIVNIVLMALAVVVAIATYMRL